MLPQFTATRALAPFGVVGRPQLGLNAVVWGNAKACNDIERAACDSLVLIDFDQCQRFAYFRCAGVCPFGNRSSPDCQDCLARERAACLPAYTAGMQACADQHGCPAGLRCLRDEARPIGDPVGTCCALTQIACAANCLPSCDPPHVFDRSSCICNCPKVLCPPHKPLNQATCQCECPSTPCPDYRMTRNPDTCTCQCPDPLHDCGGYCANLQSDPLFCGSCDAEPCDAFKELCCDGRCTNTCSDANCGSCGRAIQPGEKCCRPQCTPTRLGTDSDCADCKDKCVGGRTCTGATGGIGGTCQCPAGTRDCCLNPPCKNPCCPDTQACCNGHCCPPGEHCCGNNCVDLNTDNNNCGSCGNVCNLPRRCQQGTCQCPLGQFACGPSDCCMPGQACCNGHCCPTGQACCNNTCVNLMTDINNCGSCGNLCPMVLGWTDSSNAIVHRQTQCRNGVCGCPREGDLMCEGMCFYPYNVPPDPYFQQWASLYPGQPAWTCPNGVYTCHPGLNRVIIPPGPGVLGPLAGKPGCCPPPFTATNSYGQCYVP